MGSAKPRCGQPGRRRLHPNLTSVLVPVVAGGPLLGKAEASAPFNPIGRPALWLATWKCSGSETRPSGFRESLEMHSCASPNRSTRKQTTKSSSNTSEEKKDGRGEFSPVFSAAE